MSGDGIPMDPARREAAMALYEELARLGKAMSSPTRLQLIDLLRQGPRSVEVLAEQAGIGVANASQHLQQLKSARLVVSGKQGQRVVYRLAGDDVGAFFTGVRRLGEARLPEVDRLREALRVQDEPTRTALLERVSHGEVLLLDVRPAEEWEAGHLPGARHIPLGELPVRLDELPRTLPLVAYCRGPYCPMALAAVDVLRDAGFDADHLDLGPADVAERGGPALIRPAGRGRQTGPDSGGVSSMSGPGRTE